MIDKIHSVLASVSPGSVADDVLRRSPANSARAYEQSMRAFACFVGHEQESFRLAISEFIKLSAMNRNMLAAQFIESMRGAGISASTINLRLSTLRKIIKTAIHYGITSGDLIVLNKPAVSHDFRSKSVEPEEIVAIRKVLGSHPHEARQARDLAILSLLYPSGIRIGGQQGLRRTGILGLNVSDFTGSEVYVGMKGRAQSNKHYAIGKSTRAAIERWLSVRAGKSTSEALFVGIDTLGRIDGKRLLQQTFRKILSSAAAMVGIKTFNPHAFRHAVGTQLIRGGASITDVRDHLGHQNINTTNLYIDYARDGAAAASDKLDSLLPP